jgi:hypothetical protein
MAGFSDRPWFIYYNSCEGIAIAFHETSLPQVIFVLRGDYKRMEFAAQLWRSHKDFHFLVKISKYNG